MKSEPIYFARSNKNQINSVGISNAVALASFEGFDFSKSNTETIVKISALQEGSPERLKLVSEYARGFAK